MRTQNIPNLISTLDQFGTYELLDASRLLKAYADAGNGGGANDLPNSWEDEGVYLDFNPESGSVFLVNYNYDTLVLDADHGLCKWYYSPYYGQEGTLPELAIRLLEGDYKTDQAEDVAYLRDALRDDADAFSEYDTAAHDPIWKGMARSQVFALALERCEELLNGLDTEDDE